MKKDYEKLIKKEAIDYSGGAIVDPDRYGGFIDGANFGLKLATAYYKEEMYSESEVLSLLIKSEDFTSNYRSRTDLTHWFKGNKKKS